MLIREEFSSIGREYIRTYSDLSVYIENQQGQRYEKAVDPIEFKDIRIYHETDIPIVDEPEENTEEDEI